MHKILFIIYALFYKKFKKELWNASFEAWKYGPVEMDYRKFANGNSDSISKFKLFDLTEEMTIFLYKQISSLLKTNVWDLVDWSHSTDAYKNAIKLQSDKKIISNSDIQKLSFNFKKMIIIM